jgi:AcrR family transcriptional regulator
MDEIASDLRISKKTIYKYFATKEALLNLIIHGMVFTVRRELRKIFKEDTTSVEKILSISNTFIGLASRININILLEVKKLGPQFWATIERLRAKEINSNFGLLIEQGQKEGYIKPIPKEVILQIFLSSIQSVINPEFIVKNEFSMQQAGKFTIDILFSGILTSDGLKLYEKLKTEHI